MVVEDSVRRAHDRFTVALRVPRKSDTWLHVVGIGLNAFLYAEILIAKSGQSRRFFELRRNFHVVANAIIQRQIWARAPRILPEKSHGNIGERIAWAAESLNEIAGKT